MRGFAEESEEVRARRLLKQAARKFAAACLLDPVFHEQEEIELTLAAITYAAVSKATTKRPRMSR